MVAPYNTGPPPPYTSRPATPQVNLPRSSRSSNRPNSNRPANQNNRAQQPPHERTPLNPPAPSPPVAPQDTRPHESVKINIVSQSYYYGYQFTSPRRASSNGCGCISRVFVIFVVVLTAFGLVKMLSAPTCSEIVDRRDRERWNREWNRYQKEHEHWERERQQHEREHERWEEHQEHERWERAHNATEPRISMPRADDAAAWRLEQEHQCHAQERERLQLHWGERKREDQCSAYGTRVYKARLWGIPLFHDRIETCEHMPLSINGGVIDKPMKCEDAGMFGEVIGYWRVDFGELDCLPYWDRFYDKGCAGAGSGLHRWEARLWNLHDEDNWMAICSTTPATIRNMHFDGPKYCEDRVCLTHSLLRCG
ncbi:hypothetical protein B0H21DRAFT_733904 [Amylocystis lapponica]|nr:hypothetical protein B0H21DRAFT_733904 [Amylocystis lapponica]